MNDSHECAARTTAEGRHQPGPSSSPPTDQWLLIDRPDRAEPPVHYTLTTLPKAWSHKQIVRRTKQRWRIERTDQDLMSPIATKRLIAAEAA